MRTSAISSTFRQAAPWLALTGLIGGVDYVTPSSYAFASMYFIPIFPAAWRSRGAGFVVAAASALVWILCDIVQRPVTDEAAQFWNYSSNDLASLGELEAGTLKKRPMNIVDLVHELRSGAASKAHVLLTVPVAPLRVNVDCRSDKGGVSISIASATMAVPATAAQLVRGDDPSIGARTRLARVLLAAHGGTLSSARESMGRGQRLIARLPV